MNDLHIWREGGRYEIFIPSIRDAGLLVKISLPSEQGFAKVREGMKKKR
jgi:hypothetical protein